MLSTFRLFFEASPYREEVLKKIDEDFTNLKKSFNDQNKKQLEKHIKKFTGFKNIDVVFLKDAYLNEPITVVPVFKGNFFKTKKFKNLLKEDKINNDYIRNVQIIISKKELKDFSPKELTAQLLFEIGKMYERSTNVMDKMEKSKIYVILSIPPILKKHQYFLLLINYLYLLFYFQLLQFENKRKADFVTKYGYGDEYIKVLYKKHKKKIKSPILGKIINAIFRITFGITTEKSSICKILKNIEIKYKDQYPKEIEKIRKIIEKDIKC